MNYATKYVTALDLGSSQFVAVTGRVNENRELEIAGLVTRPAEGMRKGSIINVEEASGAISQMLEKLSGQTGLEIDSLVTGIGGQQIKTRLKSIERSFESHQHEILAKEVEEMKKYLSQQTAEEGYEMLAIVPESFEVDGEKGMRNPAGASGKKLTGNFHVLSAREIAVQNLEKTILRSGYELQELYFTPLTESAVVLHEDEKEAGVALVNFGGGCTSLSIYLDKRLIHTAIIPFGGEVITTDIKEGCSVLQRQAEMLKVQFGSALAELSDENKVVAIPGISGRKPKEISFRNLAFIIQARMEEILDAVMVEIDKSGVADKLAAGIVLSGGGAQLAHLAELINIKTGYDVRTGYAEQGVMAHLHPELRNPSLSCAFGLLQQGLQHAHLFTASQEYPEKKKEKSNKNKEDGLKEENKIISNLKRKFTSLFDEVN